MIRPEFSLPGRLDLTGCNDTMQAHDGRRVNHQGRAPRVASLTDSVGQPDGIELLLPLWKHPNNHRDRLMLLFPILWLVFFQAPQATSIEALVQQAQEDIKAERYEEAARKLGQAVQRAPDNSALWNSLGLAYQRLNQVEPAIGAFQRALELAPQDPKIYLNLGLLYSSKDDVVKALDLYRKGLELSPNDPAGNENYALLLMRMGKYQEAIDPLLRAKKENVSSLPVRLALIHAFLRGGMLLEGEAETQELLASKIASPADEVKLAAALIEDRQADLAEQVLKDAIASEPDLGDAHGVLGLLRQKQGKYDEAEKELGRAVESAPDSAKYSLALAQVRLVRQGKSQPPKQDVAWFQNTAPGVAYVGSQSCAGCHAEIYEKYRKTAMGRSISLASESPSMGSLPAATTVFDPKQGSYFQVFRRGADTYQSEYALNSEGKERYRRTEKIAYVIGAGSQGAGHIIRRGDYLFQAPLSFYARPKTWGLSPGYETDNLGFNRPVLEECIVCHSGMPQPVPGRYGLYKNPPFRELAIGCENCHGPGGLHVSERAQGSPVASGFDSTIVNPSKLPAWLADNICMNCHQGGDVRVLQPGKSFVDFRPGTPLDYTVATFKIPLKRQTPPQSDLLEHNFSLKLSRCYRASEDQLRCTTCHDPHRLVTKEEKVEYYRKKCLSCHTDASCRLSLKDRTNSSPPNDCSGCHMPKRDLKEIAHAALTNHRIVRRADEPYPEEAFRLTTPDLPNLIHVSAIPRRDAALVPPLTILQAYRTLSLSKYEEFEEPYARLLNQMAESEPENPVVLAAVAQRVTASQTPHTRAEAIGYLSRAIQLGSTHPNDYLLLADLLARSDRVSESIAVLEKGMLFAPYAKEFFQSKAHCFISMGKHSDAVATIKKGLELFPGDTALNILLKKAERTLVPSDGSKAELSSP
jgi:tetratricopeptide (TPR) repeat protein